MRDKSRAHVCNNMKRVSQSLPELESIWKSCSFISCLVGFNNLFKAQVNVSEGSMCISCSLCHSHTTMPFIFKSVCGRNNIFTSIIKMYPFISKCKISSVHRLGASWCSVKLSFSSSFFCYSRFQVLGSYLTTSNWTITFYSVFSTSEAALIHVHHLHYVLHNTFPK